MNVGSSPTLRMATRIAMTHHERWDGSGYPRGLAGEQIPLEGRITAVADVFDALSNDRPYKPAFPLEQCFTMMEAERGKHFDPRVLDAFFARRKEILRVRLEYTETAPRTAAVRSAAHARTGPDHLTEPVHVPSPSGSDH